MGSIVARGLSCLLLTRLLVKYIKVQPFSIKKTLTYLLFSIIMITAVFVSQKLTTNTILLIITGIITYLSLLFLSNDSILKKTKDVLINK